MISDYHKFIYTKIHKTGSTSIEYGLRDLVKDEPTHIGGQEGHYHLIDDLAEDFRKDYFKFTFVRNPWDRAVSFYHFTKFVQGTHREEEYKNSTFEEFIRSPDPPAKNRFLLGDQWCSHTPTLQKLFRSSHPLELQIDWITDENGKMLANFVGKIENAQHDFDIICDTLELNRFKLKVENPSKRGHYTEYYNRETRDLVARRYARDIEAFKYVY